MLKQKLQDESFTDGLAKLYAIENTAAPGNMPTENVKFKIALRYRRRTVGMQRYYIAMQHNQRIDEVIRCPLVSSVSTKNIAILDGRGKYYIRQIQYPENSVIPVMDLALEKIGDNKEAAIDGDY